MFSIVRSAEHNLLIDDHRGQASVRISVESVKTEAIRGVARERRRLGLKAEATGVAGRSGWLLSKRTGQASI
jgi:hypothetical protein|tara:strand:- start:6524 stop:6739 length:216 start_codon:yes stop_codon:yes gene_type:complete